VTLEILQLAFMGQGLHRGKARLLAASRYPLARAIKIESKKLR